MCSRWMRMTKPDGLVGYKLIKWERMPATDCRQVL